MAKTARRARRPAPQASDSEALVAHGVLPSPLLVPSDEPGVAVSAVQLAQHLDLTPARISQLASDGVIPRNRDQSYPVDSARVAYIRSLRRAASVRVKVQKDGNGLNDARLRKLELEHAIAIGEVVKIDDVEALMTEVIGAFRNGIAGLGASLTRDLQLRAAIDEKTNALVDIVRATFEAAAQAGFSDSEDAVEGEEAAA